MTRIRIRRGTSVEWATADPVLAEGEMGFETNTAKLKIGNGTTAWTELAYTSDGYATLDANGLIPQNQLPITTSDWATLEGKPAVVAAGATQEEARNAISAAALDSNGYIPLAQWGAQAVDGGGADTTTLETLDGGIA